MSAEIRFLEGQIRPTADALFSPSGRSLLSTKVTQLYGVRPYLQAHVRVA